MVRLEPNWQWKETLPCRLKALFLYKGIEGKLYNTWENNNRGKAHFDPQGNHIIRRTYRALKGLIGLLRTL